LKKLFKNLYFIAVLGFIIGVLVVLAIRFATYKTPNAEKVHYHANFAVYANGQREQFKALNYYEEEAAASCSMNVAEEAQSSPMARVHMHDNINDVVHVEDHLVTWGNFFQVLGWGVGKDYLATRDAVYTSSDQGQVSYVLNGKKVTDISNLVIGDQDKLLVNYGSQSTDQIQGEYNAIQNNAKKADTSKDPAACGGSATTKTTVSDRLHHMF
jgi:hypothetical protein